VQFANSIYIMSAWQRRRRTESSSNTLTEGMNNLLSNTHMPVSEVNMHFLQGSFTWQLTITPM
jgi:hypothetical protein